MGDTRKIVIGGDLFPTQINQNLFSEGRTDQIFGEKIAELFRDADYSICNLEGCFTDSDTRPKRKDGPNIRASRECVNAIKGLGVDCVSLANNHATDYGTKGLKETFDTLASAGITYFGAGLSEESVTTHHTIELNGKTVTFYGVAETLENAPLGNSSGVNIYDEYRICHEIHALKKACDFLVVLYHGGMENYHYNTPSIITRFHRMADSGADILISQHTHAIGEEEYYNGSYLLYGQGNFCFHFSKGLHEWVMTGLVLEVDLDEQGFRVKKHLIKREDTHIVYGDPKELTDFDERSNRLKQGDTFEGEFDRYAEEKALTYLVAFRGKNIRDKFARKILSKKKYTQYMKKRFTDKNILRILRTLECEEFREIAVKGLHNMLNDKPGE